MPVIKFRSWIEPSVNVCRPHMNYNPDFNGDINSIFEENGVKPTGTYGAKITYLQFTGLKDSQRTDGYPEGQEIYNGDILRYYSDARMYVPDGKGGWVSEGNPHLEERTVVEYSEDLGAYTVHGGSDFLFEIHEKSEVIGNIFENPELMKRW